MEPTQGNALGINELSIAACKAARGAKILLDANGALPWSVALSVLRTDFLALALTNQTFGLVFFAIARRAKSATAQDNALGINELNIAACKAARKMLFARWEWT